MDYRQYALEKLEEWVHDCLSSGDATPQEIYDTIKGVVKETQEYHQKNARSASELLDLLNGTSYIHFDLNNIGLGNTANSYICDSDNSSPECQGAWNSFWEEDQIKVDGQSHSDYWYDYDRNNPNQPNPFKDKVVKWQLPIDKIENGDTGEEEYFITFPDDLLEAANLKEGDTIKWIDNNDGSFTLKKIND